MAKKKAAVLEVQCQFGNVNLGDSTARIGVTVNRNVINPETVDELFCERRLELRLVSERSENELFDKSLQLTGVADVKSYATNRKRFSFGLTYSLPDIDIGVIAKFARRSGTIHVDDYGPIPSDEEEGGEDDGE